MNIYEVLVFPIDVDEVPVLLEYEATAEGCLKTSQTSCPRHDVILQNKITHKNICIIYFS